MEVIKEDQFRKQIKQGLKGGYLFFGPEDYMKSFSVKAAREAICPDETFAIFNDVKMDALDYSPAALLDALVPPPMMGEQKIVTLTGLNIGALREDEINSLIDAVSAIDEYDYNVLIISVPADQIDEGKSQKAPSEDIKRLSEYLTPVFFDKVSDARLATWVGKHFEHNGARASANVCYELIKYCGSSMYILSEETKKLAFYALANGRNEILSEDIPKIASPELEFGAFALANAISGAKYDEALKALEAMRFKRIDPLKALSDVTRSICELYGVFKLNEQGISQAEITSAMGFKNEYKTKICLGAIRTKNEKSLRRAIELCSIADLEMKNSFSSDYEPIERLIGSL